VERTILVVDDDAHFRRWAIAWLRTEGYDIVGEADRADTAVSWVRRLRPEVVLVDVQLPDLDGFELTELLRAEPQAPAIVLISSRDASDYGNRVSASGARGFVRKDQLSADAIERLLEASR
jgi:DNA-binding NarL/FixJ family response regulator